MDGGNNADSDHSMTWEDFFGSTTDLTPTLIGIYDSLLEPPTESSDNTFIYTPSETADRPVAPQAPARKHHQTTTQLKLPKFVTRNRFSPIRTSSENVSEDLNDNKNRPVEAFNVAINKIDANEETEMITEYRRTKIDTKEETEMITEYRRTKINVAQGMAKTDLFKRRAVDMSSASSGFENLSPNVKRMISSASTDGQSIFQPKKLSAVSKPTFRKVSHIPLVGATSKISHSGVDIIPSVDIYDQPSNVKTKGTVEKINDMEENEEVCLTAAVIIRNDRAVKSPIGDSDRDSIYDVPTNSQAIYDVPSVNTKAVPFDNLSLPYIDQSLELNSSSSYREFDPKLGSKENSPSKNDAADSSDIVTKSEVSTDNGDKEYCNTDAGKANAPAVEVSRPLSMSSIASSSSTSSSGAQNKGGVNSAYLASIESLDDHSDADMVSRRGSDNFDGGPGVGTGSGFAGIGLASKEARETQTEGGVVGVTQLQRVCEEIVETERLYVEDLRQVIEGYLHTWRREGTFSEEQLSEIFGNIEDIYEFNKSLLTALESNRAHAQSLARALAARARSFGVYAAYCTRYPRTMAALAALAAARPAAARDTQLRLGHPLPLASYLLKPVQRILKYHLLLQNLVKHCKSEETEYALLKMTGIAQHIDDMKRKHEHAVRVQEIQSLLYGWNGPDLTTYGELCAEGTFRVFGAKAMRHAFLFDKMLLITKSREDGVLAYKCHIMCNNLMLVEVVSGAPLSFHVIPWDSPRGQLTLQARSQRHKREWTLLLKRVILENYNAVIPSHARQLVMELGQNRTDDQILAEKSNILMSHSSMRKQLSAPEYLEKRKMDRDRRKSLEGGIRNRLKKTARKNAVQNAATQNANRDCSCLDSQTCDRCRLCTDCEMELSNGDLSKKRDDSPILSAKLSSSNSTFYGSQPSAEAKCAECDRSLHYIDATSTDEFTRQHSTCSKCSSDFRSSQESCCADTDGKDDSNLSINSCHCQNAGKISLNNEDDSNAKRMHKTCLKCSKIRENIAQTSTETISLPRKSRCADLQVSRADSGRSKSKEDLHRSKLPRIGTWRRKSEPGFQQSIAELDNGSLLKKCGEAKEKDANPDALCRNCGNAVHHSEESKASAQYKSHTLRPTKLENELSHKYEDQMKYNSLDIKMYNTKHLPKKISRIKKIRAKTMKDPTAKFYADLPTDNVLHISESTDSVNTVNSTNSPEQMRKDIPITGDKPKTDQDIDDETYRKLIEKTDSFKKNALEKVKFLSKQNVINELSDGDEIANRVEEVTIERRIPEEDAEGVSESCEESEKPLEQIISQLLMQNREFQKILKKHQLRNSSQRRHQRLLKSHSNPEKVIAAHNGKEIKLKPKYGRQMSAGESTRPGFEEGEEGVPQNTRLSPAAELAGESDEEHIYETLRVDLRHDNSLHGLSAKSKPIQHSNRNSLQRPKRIPSPGSLANESPKVSDDARQSVLESDYVYLTYNNKSPKVEPTFTDDGLYAVPATHKDVEAENGNDDYVTINSKEEVAVTENVYDRLTDVWQRPSELNCAPAEGYLAMCQDQESPNQPAIWLDRQKEHFNVPSDRKSGSLPRSFQVVINGNEESSLDSFKANNVSNKIYINKDGKVLSIDRPFTIASDKSDISYEDVESFMGEDGSVLKFNKMASLSRGSRTFYRSDNADIVGDSLSKSTLELEEEIDRCYKKNFIENVDNIDEITAGDVNFLNVSDQNLNQAISSSCEVLPDEENEILHPEHRIYKPSSHLMAFKNVLNRFKPKTPLKATESADESNANEVGSPEKASSKRSALNPRNYSRNLMQRFKNIIGDEGVHEHSANKVQKSLVASDIKVLVASTEDVTNTSFETDTDNDILSKSVCETPNRASNQSDLEHLSRSCDNIGLKLNELRPKFDKCHSMTSSIPTSSPIKSPLLLGQNLSKLPIYKLGSAHLGARIAQSDYADPQTLFKEESRSGLENVNVLINKNALRPDSLLSNSSHFTSSSDGNTNTGGNDSKANLPTANAVTMRKNCKLDIPESDLDKGDSDSTPVANSDDSFYEKSFERIEDIMDAEMFRDSAVYSDQEDESSVKQKIETISKSASNDRVFSCRSVNIVRKDSIPIAQRRVQRGNAPPVPAKPNFPKTDFDVQLTQMKQRSTSAVRSVQTISKINEPKRSEKSERNSKDNSDQSQKRYESKTTTTVTDNRVPKAEENGVQMKRLSIERCSLDSGSRRSKSVSKDVILAGPGVKSVLERRMEIESMTKGETLIARPTNSRRFSQDRNEASVNKPSPNNDSESREKCNLSSSVSSVRSGHKMAYKRNASVSSRSVGETVNFKEEASLSVVQVEQEGEVQDSKESWVKQIVNKFQ